MDSASTRFQQEGNAHKLDKTQQVKHILILINTLN